MLAKQDSILFIVVDLPAIGRMDLFDVDRVEVDLVFELIVDSIKGPSLGPERRSGIATKDEGDWADSEMI